MLDILNSFWYLHRYSFSITFLGQILVIELLSILIVSVIDLSRRIASCLFIFLSCSLFAGTSSNSEFLRTFLLSFEGTVIDNPLIQLHHQQYSVWESNLISQLVQLCFFFLYSPIRSIYLSVYFFCIIIIVDCFSYLSLAVLEGIAVSANPQYKVLGSTYPWIAKKVLTDSSPKLKASLQALLYEVKTRTMFFELFVSIMRLDFIFCSVIICVAICLPKILNP